MKTVQISLNSIGKVKSFVNTISQFEYDFDLIPADMSLTQNPSWEFSAWIFPSRLISPSIPRII